MGWKNILIKISSKFLRISYTLNHQHESDAQATCYHPSIYGRASDQLERKASASRFQLRGPVVGRSSVRIQRGEIRSLSRSPRERTTSVGRLYGRRVVR